jgi:hypothetical protein
MAFLKGAPMSALDELRKYEERKQEEIKEIPTKVAAMKIEDVSKLYNSMDGSAGSEYDAKFYEALQDRYYKEFGDEIEDHPIGGLGSPRH